MTRQSTADSDGLRVLGLISGTSIDGIDVAAAELRAHDGLLELVPLGHLELDYEPELRAGLLAALPPAPCSAEQLTRLDTGVGQAFATAAETGIRQLADGRIDLIASLGQTLFHWVEDGRALGSLQLGQPAWIAERTGLPVVADLRVRDIAAGGHGAPLASTLDRLWLRELAESGGQPAAALNLGGIANITVVEPDGATLAYDTGPANALLDLAAAEHTGGARHSDVDGLLAAAGTVHEPMLAHLRTDPYYAAPPPKSTGKEYFHRDYLHAAMGRFPGVTGPDLLATLTELTAVTVAEACLRHRVGTVVASGGGIRNPVLLSALRRGLGGITVLPSDELGLPGAAKEAYLTAVLGWLSWHGVPASIPAATGATGPRLLGNITPGAAPLKLAAPPDPTVTRLRVAAYSSDR